MRKILSMLGLTVAGLVMSCGVQPAFAQNRVSIFGAYDAWDFAYGVNPSTPSLLAISGSTGTGAYTVTLAYGNLSTSSGTVFNPLSVNAPITIGGGTNVETVTPSAVSCSTPKQYGTCSFTATFTYSHGNGDRVRSGDAGVQEAAAVVVSKGSGAVVLSPAWFLFEGGHSAGLTYLVTLHSIATTTYTVWDYSGITGSLSYAAASGSVYASTTHVLY